MKKKIALRVDISYDVTVAVVGVGQSIGAPMHRDIHLGDIQIDTPVCERRYVKLHFSLFFTTSDCQKLVQRTKKENTKMADT